MRYSYCWGIVARSIPSVEASVDQGTSITIVIHEKTSLLLVDPGALKPGWPKAHGDHWLRDRYVRMRGRVESTSSTSATIYDDGSTTRPAERIVWVTDETGSVRILVPSVQEAPYREGEDTELRGRLTADDWWWVADLSEKSMSQFALDISASRWHPASVAGLVVGSMGAFIFALYLRGWLRGRRASVAPQ